MNNVYTIFLKQITDTCKNKTVLIQFILFPVLALILENTVEIKDMPIHFFAKLFAVMFIGMAPLTCMSSMISEEKEKNTLRVLMMSDVKPVQYLLGTGLYIWMMCMAGIIVFAAVGEYRGMELIWFLLIMATGILFSILIGGIIGILSNNQMSAASITVPVMMVISFLPMLSMFNAKIASIAKFTYSQQINLLIQNQVENIAASILVLVINFILTVILFFAAYHRKGIQ